LLIDRSEDERREWTAKELEAAAQSVAARLHASGIRRGDRVGLVGENSAAFAAGFFGVAYAGATVVPIPSRSTEPEITHRLKSAKARAILFDQPRRDRAEAVGRALDMLAVSLDEAVTHPPHAAPPTESDPSDTALILFTSGTTGLTKGACISHA